MAKKKQPEARVGRYVGLTDEQLHEGKRLLLEDVARKLDCEQHKDAILEILKDEDALMGESRMVAAAIHHGALDGIRAAVSVMFFDNHKKEVRP